MTAADGKRRLIDVANTKQMQEVMGSRSSASRKQKALCEPEMAVHKAFWYYYELFLYSLSALSRNIGVEWYIICSSGVYIRS